MTITDQRITEIRERSGRYLTESKIIDQSLYLTQAPYDVNYLLAEVERLRGNWKQAMRAVVKLRPIADAATEVCDEVRSADSEYGASPTGATVRLTAALDTWHADSL